MIGLVAAILISSLQPPPPVPTDPAALTRWLSEDPARVWQAIAVLSKSRPLPNGVETILARHLIAHVSPPELQQNLALNPLFQTTALQILGEALSRSSATLASELASYLAATARARSEILARRATSAEVGREEVESLLNLMVVDPPRFAQDEAFRKRVAPLLPRACHPSVPPPLKDALLLALNSLPGFDFPLSESVETGWRVVPRRSSERKVAYAVSSASFGDETSGAIRTSVFSLPSRFFDAETVARFLEGVHRESPDRKILALTDFPLRAALAPRATSWNVALLETYGRRYTPWPRDPFTLLARPDGGVLVLVRPDAWVGRPDDRFMGQELIQNLPDAIDAEWRRTSWAESPIFFHNGQMIVTSKDVYVSLHTLEPRILEKLGLDRVPVERFETREGWLAYVAAARAAAAEIGDLTGKSVTWVHALPEKGDAQDLSSAAGRLGGGAGIDLDSILTIWTSREGRAQAIVADVSLGSDLVSKLETTEVERFKRAFDLEGTTRSIREAVANQQIAPRAKGLAAFTDEIARHLTAQGVAVRRLPILFVPVRLLRDRDAVDHEDFLVSWNNVVLEERSGILRAEGFESLLTGGDDIARAVFATLGVRLVLVPTLPRSVVLLGGYRCASQHVRARAP